MNVFVIFFLYRTVNLWMSTMRYIKIARKNSIFAKLNITDQSTSGVIEKSMVKS